MKNDHPALKNARITDGLRDHWPQINGTPAVFLAHFEIPASHSLNSTKSPRLIGLFSGTNPGSHGPAIHFKVLELDNKPLHEHHLHQGAESVAYQSAAEHDREAREPETGQIKGPMTPEVIEWVEFGGDVMQAIQQLTGATNEPQSWWKELLTEYKKDGKPKAKRSWLCTKLKPRFSWISHRPRWVEDEGMWCFLADKPMIFLGQVHVPDDETAPGGAPRGAMIYAFCGQAGSGMEFKVVAQTCGAQTAEDHYRLEEQIARFHQLGGGSKAARELVTKGDRWAHRFLLDHVDLARETLELLAKHAATRQLKDEAKARLKGQTKGS